MVENDGDISSELVLPSSEWIKLTIHGQSFMLNQIRKLVGIFFYVPDS